MSNLNKSIRKIRDNFSSFEDIWLFIRIFFLVTALPAMVRFLSLPKLMNVLTHRDSKVYQNLEIEKSKDTKEFISKTSFLSFPLLSSPCRGLVGNPSDLLGIVKNDPGRAGMTSGQAAMTEIETGCGFTYDLISKIVKFTDYILSRNFWIYRNTCLKRSLVLYHFLRGLGINVHICFGVRYNGMSPNKEAEKKLEGHAWLLYNGDIFLERNTESTKAYKMTYCFPDKMERI
jgi:hypothetical protein